MTLWSRRGVLGMTTGLLAGSATPPPAGGDDQCPTPAQAQGRSARDAGATGDGQTDDSGAVQSAYDHLAATGGGTLYFPSGRYRIALTMTSRDVHLCGAGGGASVLTPAKPDGFALRALYRNGAPTAVTITDLELRGIAKGRGTLFEAAPAEYIPLAEYSGGTAFSRVRFSQADKAIVRHFGTIDLRIDHCTFSETNYHVYVVANDGTGGGDQMHGGCTFISDSRLIGFDQAMLYVKSPVTGTGQIIVERCIIEAGAGFVFYFDELNGAEIPGIALRDLWNENNATGHALEISGTRHARACFLFAANCSTPILIENTPISSLTLRNSDVQTFACDLTALTADLDAGSSLSHDRATAASGTPPGRSGALLAPRASTGLRTPWFRMPPPLGRSSADAGRPLLLLDGTAPITFTGALSLQSRAAVGDEGLVAAGSQELSLPAGKNVSPGPIFVTPANTWLAVQIVAKVVAGSWVDVQLTGDLGLSGLGRLDSRDWETLVAIIRSDLLPRRTYLNFLAASSVTLRLSGILVSSFNNRQQALNYVNARLFPALA